MARMTFSLTKGTIGLRLDYLAQFRSVREYVRRRLDNYVKTGDPTDHPIEVMRSIPMGDPAVVVDVLNTPKAEFVEKLNYLRHREYPIDDTWPHVGDGPRYLLHDSNLHPHNQDSTGNRLGFMKWWMGGRPKDAGFFIDIAKAIMTAIDADRDRLEFWWDCSLDPGTGPTAEAIVQDTIVRVFFRTDGSADNAGPGREVKRGPEDPDPSDPKRIWNP